MAGSSEDAGADVMVGVPAGDGGVDCASTHSEANISTQTRINADMRFTEIV